MCGEKRAIVPVAHQVVVVHAPHSAVRWRCGLPRGPMRSRMVAWAERASLMPSRPWRESVWGCRSATALSLSAVSRLLFHTSSMRPRPLSRRAVAALSRASSRSDHPGLRRASCSFAGWAERCQRGEGQSEYAGFIGTKN